MKSIDDIQKLKAVVCYVLGKSQGGMDYIHLFKSMYFAQQEHLVKYGLPLFNDTFVVRKHGPVPSLTYKVIRCVEGKNTELTIGLEVFISALTLDRCVSECLAIDSFELSKLSHQDAAFKKARKKAMETGEDTCIPLFDIAKAGGASDSMLEIIRERQINKMELAWI